MPHRIEFFETESGRSPVKDYIRAMPTSDGPKLARKIDLLEEHGFGLLGWPQHMGSLRGSLYELRARGEQFHRIILFHAPGVGFVLLHGFSKKTNQTPAKEIAVAEQRMLIWLARTAKAGND